MTDLDMASCEGAAPPRSCVVLMLGYPGTGKRTVGGQLARQLGGVLVDNALINRPLLELLQWDGVELLPSGFWDYVAPVRDTVMRAIRDLAPASTSYVFTNVIEDGPGGVEAYAAIRSLAEARQALFLAVMLICDLDEQVSRIAAPDRVALRKGSDPEGYRAYTLTVDLFQPPAGEVFTIDTTSTAPTDNARSILKELHRRGFVGPVVGDAQ